MLNLERILASDRLMRAMTGLNRKAFEALLPGFSEAYRQYQLRPKVNRKRAVGGGRKATLRTSRDQLFYILLYCKCYPTFDLMSVLFNFDRSCAWDWVHLLLPILEQTLGRKQVLPVRKLRSMAEFLERFPEVKTVILDAQSVRCSDRKILPSKRRTTRAKRNDIRANTSPAVRLKSG